MYSTYQSKEGDHDNATSAILYVYQVKKEYTNQINFNQLINMLRRSHNVAQFLLNKYEPLSTSDFYVKNKKELFVYRLSSNNRSRSQLFVV